jgi:hypothetical protein
MEGQKTYWIVEVLKNRWVKVPVITILFCLAILGIYAVGSVLFGRHIVIFGIDLNPTKQEKSVVLEKLPSHKDSQNTLKLNPPENSKPKKANNAITQKNKNGKNEANQNPGTNNGNIGGENNKSETHTVNGTNLGINGNLNVYLNKDRTISDKDGNRIIQMALDSMKFYNVENKYVHLEKADGTNGELVYEKLADLIKAKGFNLVEHRTMFVGMPKGIQITRETECNPSPIKNCIYITIGYFL